MTRPRVWPLGLGMLALYVLAAVIEPADGAELYAAGGLAYQIPHAGCRMPDGSLAAYCRFDRTHPDPLLGHVEVGVSVDRGRWSASLYARHESQPTRFDFGCNSVGVAARAVLWRSHGR